MRSLRGSTPPPMRSLLLVVALVNCIFNPVTPRAPQTPGANFVDLSIPNKIAEQGAVEWNNLVALAHSGAGVPVQQEGDPAGSNCWLETLTRFREIGSECGPQMEMNKALLALSVTECHYRPRPQAAFTPSPSNSGCMLRRAFFLNREKLKLLDAPGSILPSSAQGKLDVAIPAATVLLDQEIKSVINSCVASLRESAFQVYIQFLNHWDNICFYMQSSLWQDRTEDTINRLSSASQDVVSKLDAAREQNAELLQHQLLALEHQSRLLEGSERMQLELETGRSSIQGAFDDLKTQVQGEQQKLVAVFNEISSVVSRVVNLQHAILGHIADVESIALYALVLILTFYLTSGNSTRNARIPLYLLWSLMLVGEQAIWKWGFDIFRIIVVPMSSPSNETHMQMPTFWFHSTLAQVAGIHPDTTADMFVRRTVRRWRYCCFGFNATVWIISWWMYKDPTQRLLEALDRGLQEIKADIAKQQQQLAASHPLHLTLAGAANGSSPAGELIDPWSLANGNDREGMGAVSPAGSPGGSDESVNTLSSTGSSNSTTSSTSTATLATTTSSPASSILSTFERSPTDDDIASDIAAALKREPAVLLPCSPRTGNSNSLQFGRMNPIRASRPKEFRPPRLGCYHDVQKLRLNPVLLFESSADFTTSILGKEYNSMSGGSPGDSAALHRNRSVSCPRRLSTPGLKNHAYVAPSRSNSTSPRRRDSELARTPIRGLWGEAKLVQQETATSGETGSESLCTKEGPNSKKTKQSVTVYPQTLLRTEVEQPSSEATANTYFDKESLPDSPLAGTLLVDPVFNSNIGKHLGQKAQLGTQSTRATWNFSTQQSYASISASASPAEPPNWKQIDSSPKPSPMRSKVITGASELFSDLGVAQHSPVVQHIDEQPSTLAQPLTDSTCIGSNFPRLHSCPPQRTNLLLVDDLSDSGEKPNKTMTSNLLVDSKLAAAPVPAPRPAPAPMVPSLAAEETSRSALKEPPSQHDGPTEPIPLETAPPPRRSRRVRVLAAEAAMCEPPKQLSSEQTNNEASIMSSLHPSGSSELRPKTERPVGPRPKRSGQRPLGCHGIILTTPSDSSQPQITGGCQSSSPAPGSSTRPRRKPASQSTPRSSTPRRQWIHRSATASSVEQSGTTVERVVTESVATIDATARTSVSPRRRPQRAVSTLNRQAFIYSTPGSPQRDASISRSTSLVSSPEEHGLVQDPSQTPRHKSGATTTSAPRGAAAKRGTRRRRGTSS